MSTCFNDRKQETFVRMKCGTTTWFLARTHALEKKMKVISQQAQLSVIYTNHSIRATAVTIFDRSGFEARQIMSVSGHRSESSLKIYCKTGQNTKEKMADSLMYVIAGSITSGSNTVTRPVENEVSSSLLLKCLCQK